MDVAESSMNLLLYFSHCRLADIRPLLESELASSATLTTAIPGMLEILPHGSSKGKGVAWVMEYLGLSTKNLMAIGDGENDVEMLQLAQVGCSRLSL